MCANCGSIVKKTLSERIHECPSILWVYRYAEEKKVLFAEEKKDLF